MCFLPGTLALGAAHGATPRGPQYDPKVSGVAGLRTHPDFILAEELMRTCYEGYRAMAAKLAPEIWRFKVRTQPTFLVTAPACSSGLIDVDPSFRNHA